MFSIKLTGISNIFTPIGKMEEIAKNADVDFTGEVAQAYVDKIRSNIDTQYYKDYYRLDPKWEKRKAKEGHGAGMFWFYMGVLYKAIQRRNIGGGRWTAGVVGSGGDIRTNPKYYGARNEAIRPLFERTTEDFIKEWNAAVKKLMDKM